MKTQIFAYLFLFNIYVCYSQDEMYVDEGMQIIDSASYLNKCNEVGLKCLQYQTDSITVNKVLNKYSFGKLKPSEYEQLRKLLAKDSKKEILPNQILIVKYLDSLRSYQTMKRNYDDHVKMHASEITSVKQRKTVHSPYNVKTYTSNLKKWIKTSNKCIKKFEKKTPASVHYVYNDDQGVLNNYDEFELTKDRSIFRTTFFKIVYNYNLLILKPDGEYFLSGSHFDDKSVKELIENEDWSEPKSDLQATMDMYKINGFGIFKSHNPRNHKVHCF
ncbi:MAG: hypothetical protein ACSHXF_08550 [Aquaticitalea sp.]